MGLRPGKQTPGGGHRLVRATWHHTFRGPRHQVKRNGLSHKLQMSPKQGLVKGHSRQVKPAFGHAAASHIHRNQLVSIHSPKRGAAKPKSYQRRQSTDQAQHTVPPEPERAFTSNLSGEQNEAKPSVEVTAKRQSERNRVQIRSALATVQSSQGTSKAKGRSVSFSPEPPEVVVVNISVEEWRGKRRALHYIVQHVEQHMKDWSVERYGMFADLNQTTPPSSTHVNDEEEEGQQRDVLSFEGSTACEGVGQPGKQEKQNVSQGNKWSEGLDEEMNFCPSMETFDVIATADNASAEEEPAVSQGFKVRSRWADDLNEEMDFSIPVLALSEGTPKCAKEDSHLTAEMGSELSDDCSISLTSISSVSDPSSPILPSSVSPLKNSIGLQYDGRLRNDRLRNSKDRWADLLDDEMDFSISPFDALLPKSIDGRSISGHREVIAEQQHTACGSLPSKSPPMPLLIADGSDPNDVVQFSILSRNLMNLTIDAGSLTVRQQEMPCAIDETGISDHQEEIPDRKQEMNGPLQDEGLSAPHPNYKESTNTVDHKRKRWSDSVRHSSSRWSEEIDKEMDFSIPPQSAFQKNAVVPMDNNGGACPALEELPSPNCAVKLMEDTTLTLPSSQPQHSITNDTRCTFAELPGPNDDELPKMPLSKSPDTEVSVSSPSARSPTKKMPQFGGLVHSPCRSGWVDEMVNKHWPIPAIPQH